MVSDKGLGKLKGLQPKTRNCIFPTPPHQTSPVSKLSLKEFKAVYETAPEQSQQKGGRKVSTLSMAPGVPFVKSCSSLALDQSGAQSLIAKHPKAKLARSDTPGQRYTPRFLSSSP